MMPLTERLNCFACAVWPDRNLTWTPLPVLQAIAETLTKQADEALALHSGCLLANVIAERLPQDGDVAAPLQANLTQAKQNPVRRQLRPTAAAGV